jgi:hypothetical protein
VVSIAATAQVPSLQPFGATSSPVHIVSRATAGAGPYPPAASAGPVLPELLDVAEFTLKLDLSVGGRRCPYFMTSMTSSLDVIAFP